MCKCHYFDQEEQKIKITHGTFSLGTGNIGDEFRFEHEDFKRGIIHINLNANELFAPPLENYSGMDERGLHAFHLSFKAIWGEE